ncbi:MAG TPA: hypothetical protein VIG08_17100 [Gemmatimonadales bacterium]|jgi:hypothetical protein
MLGIARRTAALPVLLLAAAGSLCAQTEQPAMAHAHMAFTEARPGTPEDSARALAMVEKLRDAIAPYQTLEEAEKAGYRVRRDTDMVKGARLLHAGKWPKRLGQVQKFDPTAPQALLYRRGTDGEFHLAGGMFVAAPSATLDDLDAMVPLSVAHWHQHQNICVAGNLRSFRIVPRATTEEACTKAGGRFRAQSRYMVHVMTDAGSDLAMAFPQGRDDMGAMDMGPAHEH